MANILILGAGSMGMTFSFPCSDNNHVVSIIGTYLENDFLYRQRTDSKNKEKLIPDKVYSYQWDAYENWIYYK